MVTLHAFFWGGIAIMKENYLKYFTAWAMALSGLAYTLLVIAHLKEYCAYRKRINDTLGMESQDGSTFLV